MRKTLSLISGLVAALLISRANATLVISTVGLDSTTTNDWRTTTTIKPFNDRNNIYGTLGYFTFATGGAGQQLPNGTQLFSTTDQYGGVLTTNTGGTLTVSEHTATAVRGHFSGAYANVDNPALTPGPSVADEVIGFAFRNSASPNTLYTLLDLTVGAGMPADFRLGIMDNGANGTGASYSLLNALSTNSVALATATTPRYAFFDIHGANPGDVFSIAVSTTGGATALGLAAITVDTIPEPSTMLLFALGALLVRRQVQKRRR